VDSTSDQRRPPRRPACSWRRASSQPSKPTVSLTLAQAVIKGDKMDDIVRDAVMLGVAAVQPLVTARAESTVAALTNGNRLDRWRRVALASTKQSKRAVLPDVRRPLTLESFLQDPQSALNLMLVEPGAGGGGAALSAAGSARAAGCDESSWVPREDGRKWKLAGARFARRAARDAGPSDIESRRDARRRHQRFFSTSGVICSGFNERLGNLESVHLPRRA